MREIGSAYCGKEGRQARANVREMLRDDFNHLLMGYDYDSHRALSHVDSCSNCHRKINERIFNNPDTQYRNNIEETLSRARDALRNSEQRVVYIGPKPAEAQLESRTVSSPLLGGSVADLSSNPTNNALVPADFRRRMESGELNFRNLPQLQKVAVITYLLLNAKENFYKDSANKRTEIAARDIHEVQRKKKEAGEIGNGISLGDLLSYSEDFVKTWLETDERDREKLPEIVAQKILEKGNPFGLNPEVVRAILEMANDFYETQLYVDSIKIGTYDPDWHPVPTLYLTGVIEDMFEHGGSSGRNPFSRTKFPAGNYYHEIFTPDAAMQMQNLITARYRR